MHIRTLSLYEDARLLPPKHWKITVPVAVKFDGLQPSSIKIKRARGDHWLA
jgi:hypothetical protein